MPPKSRGHPKKILHQDGSTEQVFDIISIGDSSDSSVIMTGRKPAPRGKGKGKAKACNSVPEVYRDMLAEALPMQSEVPGRPLKRRRIGQRNDVSTSSLAKSNEVEDEEDVEFEDVLVQGRSGPDEESDFPPKSQQTIERSDDSDSESDFDWENIYFDPKPQEEPSGDLELTLKARPAPLKKATATRRKVVTKEEKALRLQIHKMHVLCLLAFVDRRNDWCSDPDIQASLRPLLTKKMIKFLNPSEDLSQFARTNSLKRGLDDVAKMWNTEYKITERGMRRALWADDDKDLQNYKLPGDSDSVYEKSDFRAAAKALKGSRDVGAQLYCALLRSAGVEARLVCSLQPLSFIAGGPSMPRSSSPKAKAANPESSDEGEAVDVQSPAFVLGSSTGSGAVPFSARQRLGHPNAADYNLPDMSSPSRPPPLTPKRKTIFESQYPVFWVEVLDVAHQKWFPVDPLVTETISKPQAFEPPASDRENAMSYVIAFEDEGSARDVTRRYTKAYNAKTRKNRVESTPGGETWWRKTMRHFSRGWKTDFEQIEDNELAGIEAREPMPRNVADFKDHPYYALERHLRRNEILVGNHSIGTVAAGRDTTSATPGKKKLEQIFRRKDVKIVRSADAWYRLGREIKNDQQPVKVVPAKRRPDDNEGILEGIEERAGTNLYTEDQTQLYIPEPVKNGIVKANRFDNIDIYVPSMVPEGGVHIPHAEAPRAARLLGISFANALTGWKFHGRHGTAILTGGVVASEYREAVEAVIEGFEDERVQAEEKRRSEAALNMWLRFARIFRIKQYLDETHGVVGEDTDGHDVDDEKADLQIGARDGDEGEDKSEEGDEGMESEEYDDDDMAGGFFPE